MSGADFADYGFASPRAAQMLVRRLKLRAALQDARGSIECLLKSLDEAVQADCGAHAALFDQGGGLVPDALDRVQRNRAINPVAGDNVREKELLEGVELVLQLLDAVGVGIRHGLFSSYGGQKPTPPSEGAHRLCGGAQ